MPKLIPMFKAAKILGLSKKAVSKLGKQGMLNVVCQGRLRRFYESEVRQLKKLRKSGFKTKDLQEEIVVLRYKLERVKLLAKCVVERLDIQYKPVTFQDQELNYWYEAAATLRHEEHVDIGKIDLARWLTVLQSIHELEYKRLKHFRGDPMPYLPFIAACEKLSALTRTHQGKKLARKIDNRGWSSLFMIVKSLLRQRAVNFDLMEGPDLSPVDRVDLIIRLSYLCDALNIPPNPSPEDLKKAMKDVLENKDKTVLDFDPFHSQESAMNDETISLTEAAAILGTSRPAVGRWGQEGILTLIKEKGRKRAYRNEVFSLLEMRERTMNTNLIGEEMRLLRYELLKLDRLVEAICDHVGIVLDPMTFTDEELVAWHAKAKKLVEAPGYDNSSFDYKMWLRVLQSLDQHEFGRLVKLTGDAEPYGVFIKLTAKVIKQGMPDRYKHARRPLLFLDWINRFQAVQKKLRDEAIIFMKMRQPRLHPSLFADMVMSRSMPPSQKSG